MSAPSILPPKRRPKDSKKTKKSWRKNVDIEDIEEFLEDERLEQRLGGKFADRKDEDLFVVDNQGEEEGQGQGQKKTRGKKEEKPLKCFQHLEVTSGVNDPKKGRNKRKTPEQRKNPIVRQKEQQRIKNNVLK